MSENQSYSDLANQIRESVTRAVEDGDFSGLSDTIGSSVKTVLGSVGDSINSISIESVQKRKEQYGSTAAERYHREQQEAIERNKAIRASRNAVRPVQAATVNQVSNVRFRDIGMLSGPIYTVVGGFLGVIFLMAAAGFLLDMEILGAVISLIFVAGGGILAKVGLNRQKLLKIARRYRSLCSSRMYAGVDQLAHATGTSNTVVIKNIKKILEKGFFPEGYIDEAETTFMVSRSVYDQYKESSSYKLAIEQKQAAAAAAEEKLTPKQKSELDIMIEEGNTAARRLHELNDDIPGEEISDKLDRLESLTDAIFDRLRQHPEQMDNCHKLMDYYLPTMLKLVEAYAEYDKVKSPGKEIQSAKVEIEKTLDIINDSFVELQNRLFKDSVWDVTADAKVLKTILKQDGLAGE